MKSHNGFVHVNSEPGSGTTFEVYLPTTKFSTETRKEPPEELVLPRGKGETVLIVDDEASILAVTTHTLETLGYRTLSASNGAEALALYAQFKHEIAAVLTDMAMPVMDGATTIRGLTQINPEVRIIASSGWTANGSITKATEAGTKNFLAKPYTAGALLKTLRSLLDGESAGL